MAMDFPAAPVLNQEFTDAVSGKTWIWDSVSWKIKAEDAAVAPPPLSATVGDVKSGFQTADHGPGWILLNGRAVSTLTASQQTAAASLGFTANLPNGEKCSLRQDAAAALGVVGGSAKIAVTNLPAHNMTAASGGAHTHVTDSQGAHKHNIQLNDNGLNNSPGDKNIYSLVVSGGAVKWSSRLLCADDNGTFYQGTGNFMDTGGAHTHTAASAGAHTHTVALGGGAVDYYAKAIVANFFCWLGA